MKGKIFFGVEGNSGYPLGDFILIKREKSEEKLVGSGIIVPAKEALSNIGEVFDISESVKDPRFSVGDIILFSSYSNDKIIIDEEEYLLMPIKDAKFVIKK